MRSRYTIAVIGDGAASALVGLHLARAVNSNGRRCPQIQILIIGPNRRTADGTAFGTSDPRHLLNVPADSMSAIETEPDHFLNWLRQCHPELGDPSGFIPRGKYGDYLRDTLSAALNHADGRVSLTHVHGRATSLETTDDALVLSLDNGDVVTAHGAVLATGLPPAGVSWAPFELRHAPRFVCDPWAPHALDAVRTVGDRPDVLLVGTGLTMVDIALSLCRSGDQTPRTVYAVSRSGRLPHRHREDRLAPVTPDISQWGSDLESIRTNFSRHVTSIRDALGDWRPAVDGLRCHLPALWARMDEGDRETFLRTCASDWNRLRHRIPHPSAAELDRHLRSGRVVVTRGQVSAAQPLSDGIRVTFDNGSTRDFGWVLNCTGPQPDLPNGANGLLSNLLHPRRGNPLIQPSTSGMGVRTVDGRLLDSTGSTQTPIWAIGALRRGELWESTAVPDIRGQAEQVAISILQGATRSRTSTPEGPLAGQAWRRGVRRGSREPVDAGFRLSQ